MQGVKHLRGFPVSLLEAEVCRAEGGLWSSEEPESLLMFTSATISLQPQRGGLQSGRELKMSVTILQSGDKVFCLLGQDQGSVWLYKKRPLTGVACGPTEKRWQQPTRQQNK